MTKFTAGTTYSLTATHCLCCGRSLTDPDSVETGIGPVCSKRYGYGVVSGDTDVPRASLEIQKLDDDLREWVTNVGVSKDQGKYVHALARNCVYTLAALLTDWTADTNSINVLINVVRHLGYTTLADKLTERTVSVTLSRDDDNVVVTTKYNKAFITDLKNQIHYTNRKWDPNNKVWRVSASAARKLWDVVQSHFSGSVAYSEKKGLFVI